MPSARQTSGIKDSNSPSDDIFEIDPDEAAKLITETELMIQSIRNGETEGEYFEF